MVIIKIQIANKYSAVILTYMTSHFFFSFNLQNNSYEVDIIYSFYRHRLEV